MKTITPDEVLVIEVGDERIAIDETYMDFSDLTPEEMVFVAGTVAGRMLKDGEPTAGATAVLLAVKLSRGRDWDKDTLKEVITLLIAWLTNELEEV